MSTRTRVTEHERARRTRGLGVVSLGTKVDVSHAYVSRIEGGRVPASAAYRRKVAKILGLPEDILFDDKGFVR